MDALLQLLPAGPALAVFMLSVLALNATPGVDLALTLARSLQQGPRAGVAVALGINLGCVVHALLAAFGLAALLAVSPWAFAALKWAGAAWLAWLSFGLLRQAWAGGGTAPAVQAPPLPFGAGVREGLVTNVLNPKVALFFLAFLPQFIAADAPHKTERMLVLGALFVAQSLAFLLAVVAVCSLLRRLRLPAWVGRALQALGGLTMLGLSMRLAEARA